MQDYLRNLATGGSTMPIINKSDFEDISILLPPLPTQTAIAEILSSLDDKIELNNAINKNLEDLAQALFKRWFVDFEFPDENGQPYKSSGGEMVESELGMIPKGWKVSTIGEIARVIDCLHSKKPLKVLENTGTILLQLNNILDSGLLSLSDKYFINDKDYKKWTSRIEVCEGDLVITNVGRSGAVARIPKKIRAALGRNMTAIRLKEVFPYKGLIATLMKSDWMKKEIESKLDAGTILDSLNVRSIPMLRFVLGDESTISKANIIFIKIWEQMESCLGENYQLQLMRDTLLPKLISGELEAKETK